MRTLRYVGLLAIAWGVAWNVTAAMAEPEAGFAAYKFTNTTGQTAFDLHIGFDQPVTWTGTCPPQTPANTFTSCTGKGTIALRMAGGSVANGASVSITLPFDVRPAKVEYWYWTNANGLRIGWWQLPPRPIIDVALLKSGAMADGTLTFKSCCDADFVYTTVQLATAALMAADLAADVAAARPNWIIYVDPNDPERVVFLGGCYGNEDTCPRSSVVNTQPSYATFSVTSEQTPVPAVSEWGLAALTLLVLAAGTIVLMRRRTAATA
jgi:hypothetical protein